MPSHRQTRRKLLKSTASSSLGFAIPNVFSSLAYAANANEQIRVGLIGCGVRGKYLIANLPDEAKVTALCDCSLSQINSVRNPRHEFALPLARFAASDAPKCATHQDYRIMLDRERLDAVIIAAPDHHHALPTMLACERGMDVYVEKPLSLTIAEGRAMVRSAKMHKRVIQVGSQQRTMAVNRFACEFIRDGGLGKVNRVQLRNFPGPMRYEALKRSPQRSPPPSDLDWDLFCGPTTPKPYDRDLWVKDAYKCGFLTWRGWDLFRSFSGHLMTNWGGHSVDMVQYALGMDHTGPIRVEIHKEEIDKYVDDMWHEKTPPLGTIDDDRSDKLRFAPVSMHYANGVEVRFDPSVRQTVFHGERGKLFLSRNKYRTEPANLAPPPDPIAQAKWEGEGHIARPHLQNWLACIRSRDTPNAPIEVGHRTATACHLANIARELGSTLNWNPETERFDSPSANALLSRERRRGFELPETEKS